MVWNSPHFRRVGGREKFNRPRILSISFQTAGPGKFHSEAANWEVPTIALSILEQRWLWKSVTAEEGLVLFTRQKWNTRGREKEQICAENVTRAVTWALSELCLSEGLVTLWKSLLSGCYYCSQFPTKISLLSSPAMQPLAEKKQNLCVAARAAKLKVRVQRQIAASPGLGLELTPGTSHAPTRESARDLWRQTPGQKPKRKHPSKMQIGEKRVSSSSLGLRRWSCLGFSCFSGRKCNPVCLKRTRKS